MSTPAGTPIGHLVKRPDEKQLFLYGAATWNAHRIHYDRDHARYEGFDDIVVHGPLQGNWLVELVGAWAGPAAHIDRVRYRNLRTAYVNREYTVTGEIVDVRPSETADRVTVECRARVSGPDGVTTEGTIVVTCPADVVGGGQP